MRTVQTTLHGHYYEVRGDDARDVARIMGITLMHIDNAPLCAIPRHCRAEYEAELLAAGIKLA